MTLHYLQKITIVLGLLLGGVIVGTTVLGMPPTNTSPELSFPILETDRISSLRAYHTPDWGEPGVFHNGIDLVTTENVTIVSPITGVVISVTDHINTYGGNTLFEIHIAVNWFWIVNLVLEPDGENASINSMQRESIIVKPLDRIEQGDEVAILVFNSDEDAATHLHYGLSKMGSDTSTYDYSSTVAQSTFEQISEDTNCTIQYDYEEPNPIVTPLGIGMISLSTGMIILVILSIRKGR